MLIYSITMDALLNRRGLLILIKDSRSTDFSHQVLFVNIDYVSVNLNKYLNIFFYKNVVFSYNYYFYSIYFYSN